MGRRRGVERQEPRSIQPLLNLFIRGGLLAVGARAELRMVNQIIQMDVPVASEKYARVRVPILAERRVCHDVPPSVRIPD